jgi:hypothetical protein
MNNLRILPSIKTSPKWGSTVTIIPKRGGQQQAAIFLVFPEGKQCSEPPHFSNSPPAKRALLARETRSQRIPAAKSLAASGQRIGQQVLLYCFRLGKCGTFMPLSGVRGDSRIAVVWTLFVLVFSSFSSVHFSILFTRAVLSSVDSV